MELSRAKRITDAWAEQKIVREIMVFLHSNGVGTARAVRIYKTYGADAVQVMAENPYRLARDIRGIGFKTADAIAMKLGIEKTAMIRLRAGISHALTEATDEGHCGLPTDKLIPLAEELLEAPKELILAALELELSDGNVIADKVGETACTFLAGLYRAEQTIAAGYSASQTLRCPGTGLTRTRPFLGYSLARQRGRGFGAFSSVRRHDDFTTGEKGAARLSGLRQRGGAIVGGASEAAFGLELPGKPYQAVRLRPRR